MAMSLSFKKFGFVRDLKRFFKQECGNVSIMFGIAAVPLFLAGGAAIDYERAINAKTMLQASLDSAALYAAALTVTDDATLTLKSKPYVVTNYNNVGEATLSNYGAHFDPTTFSIQVTGQVAMKTWFMAIVGQTDLPVTAFATAKRTGAKLEVALVLDNTGSMGQSGKIEAEIAATKSLLVQLQGMAVNPDDVYASIIPFDIGVNVNTTNAAATWVGWNDYGTCRDVDGKIQSPITRQQCKNKNMAWTLNTVAQRANWNGCVTDRGDVLAPAVGNFDTNATLPNIADPATLFQAVNSGCVQKAMSLSNNWAAMTATVNAMAPNSNTNQNIGLAHGWMSLNGGGPYTVPTLNPSYTYQKAVVLLTDGLNTGYRWKNDSASSSNPAPIDARENLTCTNMKAEGIVVYTVQVNTGTDPVSPILQSCASDPSKFFYLTSATQINTAFASIGQSLGKMYLSQ
jgi:Flp pilus assembly protein TadG